MLTRSTIVYLMILTAIIMVLSTGCSSDQPKEKKTDDKTTTENTGTTETNAALNPNAALTETQQTETPAEDGNLTGMDSATNTGEEMGDTSATSENTSTDSIVRGRDMGMASTPTGMQPSQTPVEKKEINSRGDVNIKDKVAIIKTNYGDVYFFFFPEIAPNHVRNFIYLAEKKFYDNVPFHRIITDFMAQAGMQRSGWTEELPQLKLEVDPQLKVFHRPGALAAARTQDPNSATSQFFIDFTEERTKGLNGKYTVYGQMFKGQDTLDKLNKVKLGPNAQSEVSEPLEDVHIITVVIEDASKYDGEIKRWKAANNM